MKKELTMFALFGANLVVLAVLVIFYPDHTELVDAPEPPAVPIKLSVTEALTTEQPIAWGSYVNKTYGFAFAYPPGWNLGRDFESTYGDIVSQEVTLDYESPLGHQSFDMQVSRRGNPSQDVTTLLSSFGSKREYKSYETIAGVPAVYSLSGEVLTINFSNDTLFFNIDAHNVSGESLRTILDTFVVVPPLSDLSKLQPAYIPTSQVPFPACPSFSTSTQAEALVDKTWQTYVDKEHCFGFMYPSDWKIGTLQGFFPIHLLSMDDNVHRTVFQYDGNMGREMLIVNITPLSTNYSSLADVPSRGNLGTPEAYGKVVGADATLTVSMDVSIVRFLKSGYLFEVAVTGVEPLQLRHILDTFVVALPASSPTSAAAGVPLTE